MTRINPSDTTQEAVLKMSAGNPGAMRTLVTLLKNEGGRQRIVKLDELGHYGAFIWLIYKDLLDGDIPRMEELIDNNQLDDEIERRIQDDEHFAKTWRWHLDEYTPAP